MCATLIGALVASSSRARAQLRKNENKYIFIQVGPNLKQKYHAIYQTTGKFDTEFISEVKINFSAFWPAR